ncbi:MAG: protein phosphatase 2C domain-containing protein [Sulfuriferula multivorans]|uniref:Protein phosphatase 2C domain-containing protein n=1 Tax=Sulfuriferula multivorans TaxID=1559896 RepID=A0A7C9P2B8_9PROT|nr:protein phosphatase 2C domain-containing protein [Sulfuriferula multivorans]
MDMRAVMMKKHIRSFIQECLKPEEASDVHGFMENKIAVDALMQEIVKVVQKHWRKHLDERKKLPMEVKNNNEGDSPETEPTHQLPATTPQGIVERPPLGHGQTTHPNPGPARNVSNEGAPAAAAPTPPSVPAPAPSQAVEPVQPIKASPVVTPNPATLSAPAQPAVIPKAAPHAPAPLAAQVSFRFVNGKSGVEYCAKPTSSGADAATCKIKLVELPSDIGLSWDASTGEIKGIPGKDGSFEVKVWFAFGATDSPHTSKTELVINPDPKSLWKDLPSNREDPYWKADEDSKHVQGDNALMVAASKRGRSHAHVGSFRDDDFLLSYLPEGQWHIAIVSDGAGSAKFSRRGSEIICHNGGKHLKELLSGEGGMQVQQATEALHQARVSGASTDAAIGQLHNALFTTIGYTAHHVTKAIMDEFPKRQELGAAFKDYSSTALIGLCRRFPFGVLCATYWVGDGAVAIMRNSHDTILLGEADSGEFSGQTRFLDPAEVTQEALLKRIRFELIDDFKAMILMSDGISDPFFETDANLGNHAKWVSLWKDLDDKAQIEKKDVDVAVRLLAWLDFWSPGNHDDRTIAAIY